MRRRLGGVNKSSSPGKRSLLDISCIAVLILGEAKGQ